MDIYFQNHAVYCLAAYYILAIVPHVVARAKIAKALKADPDFRPLTSDDVKSIQKLVPPQTWKEYEYLEGLYTDSHAYYSLFASAIIVGILSGQNEWLNTYAFVFLGCRVIYALPPLLGRQNHPFLSHWSWLIPIVASILMLLTSANRLVDRLAVLV